MPLVLIGPFFLTSTQSPTIGEAFVVVALSTRRFIPVDSKLSHYQPPNNFTTTYLSQPCIRACRSDAHKAQIIAQLHYSWL
ncbi:uncharacterized protein F4812DRAFT_416485 [Daldinia caldariorum]|uniref:uncharacterized protein n=1 Tax=Daldinia caldariorum TaxID=326644 RepID=UPI0020079935|nr:uncharacterized protein F4812DRAFT_416485 [Daldinia caldariorum]KAI1472062.1 hypothetical protein F4812DRAFT_416485 [Daldinia caldariorum]